MKIYVGIDGSTTCTGYSVFDQNKNLIKYGQIKPKATLDVIDRIDFIAWEFYKILTEITKENETEKVIIEDIYLAYHCGGNQVLGFANLARLSGAIMFIVSLITGKKIQDIVTLRGANVARPMVGLKGNCQKAEVQVWVLKKFFNKDVSEYEGLIEAIQAKKSVGDIDQKEYKKRMEVVSKLIKEETDIGEDIADAVLLSMSEIIKNENK